jgi:hypothetical protein
MAEPSEYYYLIKRVRHVDPIDPDLDNHKRLIRDLLKKNPRSREPLEIYESLVADLRRWHHYHRPAGHPWTSVARCMADDLEEELSKDDPSLDVLRTIVETARKPTASELATIPAPRPDAALNEEPDDADLKAYTLREINGEPFVVRTTDAELEAALMLAFCCKDAAGTIMRSNAERVELLATFRRDGYIVPGVELPPGMLEQMLDLFELNTEQGFASALDEAIYNEWLKVNMRTLKAVAKTGDTTAVRALAERERLEQLKSTAGNAKLNPLRRFFDRKKSKSKIKKNKRKRK